MPGYGATGDNASDHDRSVRVSIVDLGTVAPGTDEQAALADSLATAGESSRPGHELGEADEPHA